MPVYGAVPPAVLTVTVVVPPLQFIVPADDDAVNTGGCVTVTEEDAVQLFASFTITLYVPAGKVAVFVV